MAKLILLRHGESEWNKLNLFTGWEDVGLSDKGIEEAKWAGQILLQKGILPDICFTSLLKRAVRTLNYVLEETDLEWLPVVKTVMLNERHYGILQGLNKAETAIKYGEEQVRIWRRSYDVRPPALNEDDPRNPRLQKKYADSKIRPLCESLEDVVNRVLPYYDTNVLPLLWRGKNVLFQRTEIRYVLCVRRWTICRKRNYLVWKSPQAYLSYIQYTVTEQYKLNSFFIDEISQNGNGIKRQQIIFLTTRRALVATQFYGRFSIES